MVHKFHYYFVMVLFFIVIFCVLYTAIDSNMKTNAKIIDHPPRISIISSNYDVRNRMQFLIIQDNKTEREYLVISSNDGLSTISLKGD